MDEFEREYFQELKKLAGNFSVRRRELAKSRIKMFAAAITRQLITEQKQFDLVVSAGNSGLFMMHITRLVFEALNKDLPPTLILPILRFKEEKISFDNSVLQTNLDKQKALSNTLFVDDEAMQGITAKNCFEILAKANPSSHFNATIVAENHFFEWHYEIPHVSMKFFAHARLIQGLNGNIGYFVPKELFEKITTVLPEVQSYNHAMALVISGKLKRMKDDIPYFDETIEPELIEKIPGYKNQKQKLLEELKALVKESVEEYQTGKISFRF